MCKLCNQSIENQIKSGRFFGYPECCITYFVNIPRDRPVREKIKNWIVNPEYKLNGSGFVPCPSCAAKVKSGETTLTELINSSINERMTSQLRESWSTPMRMISKYPGVSHLTKEFHLQNYLNKQYETLHSKA